MPLAFWLAVAFLFGLNIGSFLNVAIWRLPRGGSIAAPTWSYCPRCEHRLGALDLFPVLSYAVLGAKCRYCRAPISARYPAIELLTALLFTLVAWRFGGTVDTIFYCAFTAVLICVFFIDLEHFVIPDGLSVFGVLLGFAHNGIAMALREPGQWTRWGALTLPSSLTGAVGYAAVFFVIGLVSYTWLIGVADRRMSAGRAALEYTRESLADWAWVVIYHLSLFIPPLRRHAEPPEPLVGTNAEEIAGDEDEGGLGGGDVKLGAAIGAVLYLPLALQSFFWAVFLGTIAGLIVMARQRRRLGERTHIPFGPALAAGALIALFFGKSVVSWYVAHFLSYPGSPFGA